MASFAGPGEVDFEILGNTVAEIDRKNQQTSNSSKMQIPHIVIQTA
jgi:hypothetical protein